MAKLVIQTEKDLQKLQGKFVIQLDNHSPDKEITQMEWGFVKEKRLYLIAGHGYTTLWGSIKQFESFDRFKNFFNSYLFDHMIKEGKTEGDRFHRLLYKDELEYLFRKVQEENNG